MEFSIFIKKRVGIGLLAGIVIFFSYPETSHAQAQKKVTQTTLNNQVYISAFAPVSYNQDTVYYTIQICTMEHVVKDHFLQEYSKIKVIRMGDLYRYIYSQYQSLSKAREDLIRVRKIYPDAFIREYRHGQLGLAIDMNTEQLRIKHRDL